MLNTFNIICTYVVIKKLKWIMWPCIFSRTHPRYYWSVKGSIFLFIICKYTSIQIIYSKLEKCIAHQVHRDNWNHMGFLICDLSESEVLNTYVHVWSNGSSWSWQMSHGIGKIECQRWKHHDHVQSFHCFHQ